MNDIDDPSQPSVYKAHFSIGSSNDDFDVYKITINGKDQQCFDVTTKALKWPTTSLIGDNLSVIATPVTTTTQRSARPAYQPPNAISNPTEAILFPSSLPNYSRDPQIRTYYYILDNGNGEYIDCVLSCNDKDCHWQLEVCRGSSRNAIIFDDRVRY